MQVSGMPSFDGSLFHNRQAEREVARQNPHTKTTANVFTKVKDTVASAFRAPQPAMVLA